MNQSAIFMLLAAVFLLEFAAFGMQRTLLLLSREKQAPYNFVAQLLPAWFPVVWALRLAKWGLYLYIAFYLSWLLALGLLVADFLLSAVLPIPLRSYGSIFRTRAKQLRQRNEYIGQELENLLVNTRVLGS